MPSTFTLVFVSWNPADNSPCKLNVFTKRYIALLNNEITKHHAILFTPRKKLSHKVTQLLSLSFEETTNHFSIFCYVVNKLALLCSICFVLKSLLVKLET